ncbi:MAG TPA: hypothetical protein VLC30_17625 [Pseudomonas sp.]|nr:hypothetical protein [Pseudomonas sp.]
MRYLLLLNLLALAACASPLPSPDPQKAWVEVDSWPGDMLMANKLDGLDLRDGRFFQVPPGKHELEASFRFEVHFGGFGAFGSGPQQTTCYLRIRYDHFVAGQRYRMEARPMQARARGWLYDAQGNVLARATVVRCGSF